MKDFAKRYPGMMSVMDIYSSALDSVGSIPEMPAKQMLKSIQLAMNSPALLQIQQQQISLAETMKPYLDSVARMQQQLDAFYAPLQNITKSITSMTVEWSTALQATKMLQAIPHYDFGQLSQIAKAVQTHFDDIQPLISDISEEDLQEYCEKEEITPETVAEAVETICAEASKENVTIPDRLDKVKRTNWFFALTIIWMIFSFLGKPAIDHLKDDALQAIGITQMWEDSGIYEWMDQLFNTAGDSGVVSEDEAKASIDAPTGNIAKAKREELLGKIGAIRAYITAASQDENTGNLMTYLSELEKELGAKKYGLVFEQHREAIDGVLEEYTPVLTEDKPRFIDHGGEVNFLLEGDNLAALKILAKTHLGKIDLIYIDPPYNTLKDGFTYLDRLVDGTDTFRHSKWLSFMQRRLSIAYDLLSSRGVIFVSVDENEFAQAKLLCDGIFSETNFIECLVWNKRVPKNDKGIGNIHEYILAYAKNNEFKYKFMVLKEGLKDIEDLLSECRRSHLSIEETEARLRGLYKKGKYDRAITLYNCVDEDYRAWGKINMSWPNGNTFGPRYDVVHPTTHKPVKVPDRGWRWSEETFFENVDYEHIVSRYDGSHICGRIWFSKDEKMQPSSIKYLDEVNRMLLRSIISLKSDGSIELEKYFGEKSVFAYPKSVELLRMLIDSITYENKSCTILDFFAGSGTTGQAVMKLNFEDGGHRRFILCTNNENGICENVTYERLKRVMEQDGYEASLKYQRIEYVPISERVYYEYANELLRHVRELVELENGINFTGNAEIAIVLTDEELEDFLGRPDDFAKCRSLYLGHDILPTGEQVEQLQTHRVQVHVIPDYYYRELEG